MIDTDLILNNPEIIKNKLKSRAFNLDLEQIKKLTTERKKYITAKESLSAEKNILIKSFNEVETDSEKEKLKVKSKELELKINKNKSSLQKIQINLDACLLDIPNIPDEDVPIGEDETSNKTIKKWGEPAESSADHSEIFKKKSLQSIYWLHKS